MSEFNPDTRWQFWIDWGGTFTDIVALRPDGQLIIHKLLSENPERYADVPVHPARSPVNINAMISEVSLRLRLARNEN